MTFIRTLARTGALVMATLSALSASASASLSVTHLRCEDTDAPQLVDTATPRFSWRLESAERAVAQTAYQLRLAALDARGQVTGPVLHTEKVSSAQSQWVPFANFRAEAQTRYQWQVKVWDNHGRTSDWSEPAVFETSLLDRPWRAAWITDGRPVANGTAPPARYLRKSFALTAAPVHAKLYLSAFGLAEPWLNGRKVTEDYFLPGWPDYRKRNFYVSYDVTNQVQAGDNTFGIVLGDGWFSGTLFLKHQYDTLAKVSGWLEITHADGSTRIVATDDQWEWSEGPITAQGIYFGESVDARRTNPDWCTPSDSAEGWQPVLTMTDPGLPLHARHSPPVRRIEELTPMARREVKPGVFLYDLGQNMVGWVRLKVAAPAGEQITLRFAEMLDADGHAYTANLRGAEATARYIACGDAEEIWEPSFTFFGFRYVEMTSTSAPLDDAITGIVVHSDLKRIGHFECSHPLLNQLYSNTLWGQKGNFLELPTDCPQRDERLGWTGDAQVFAHTAHYNLRSGAFYRQWLAAVRDSFEDGPDGGFGGVAPITGFQRGAAGWSDAGAIIPWINWLHTADRRVLEESFDTVQRWVALQAASAPDGIRLSKEGWGDWLAPGYEPKKAPTPYVLIATAYFAYSTQLAAQMAEILDRPEIARQNRALHARVKAAFQREFISADGRITSDEQTAYLLALGFNLVSDELRPAMVQHLERAVAVKNNHLATGFIGTPMLTPVLTEIGRTDLAYAVLLQETYPGWLFSVKNGATTIWERWDSWTPEIGFNPGGMNSFNHYAYGSVVGWFYDTIAGLTPLADAPGWQAFAIAPQPGGGLTHARASLETPHGLAQSAWRITANQFELDVTIPANTRARVTLPTTDPAAVSESGRGLSRLAEVSELNTASGKVSFMLPSGTYQFVVSSYSPAP